MIVNPSDHLSPHFTLGEMIASQTARRHGLDNFPSPAARASLAILCTHVLEPVRAHYGRPVLVSSGYRSPVVNLKCGGASSSQHCLGEAADFTVPGIANAAVCEFIAGNLAFDQLIYEFGPTGWVHVSYRVGRLRRETLSARRVGRRTVYSAGIVE